MPRVLNDVLDDGERDVILAAFAATVRTGGLLVLDVRDWEATVREKTARPVHERTVETEQGTLTFRSETRLDPAARRLLIAERHVLARAGQTRSEAYDFVMRCWTRDELETRLTAAGFDAIEWHGGYDAAAAPGTGDRLVVVAARRPRDDDRGVDCRPSSARREVVAPMPSLLPARTLTVSIDCPPDRVYAFVRNPANLPRFIAFVNAVRETGDRWVAETTQGPLGWAFVPDNDLGVLDHVVTRADSQAILNPMRVVANGGGSEVIFTLFHRPGMTVVQFAEDAALVERDLLTLKRVLESGGVR